MPAPTINFRANSPKMAHTLRPCADHFLIACTLPDDWSLAEYGLEIVGVDGDNHPHHLKEDWNKYGQPLGLVPARRFRGKWSIIKR